MKGRSKRFNTMVFLGLFILSLLIQSASAFDVTSNVTIHQDDQGRNFILIDEGTDIELTCENFQGDHKWQLPDNSLVLGFTAQSQSDRIRAFAGHDSAEQKLTIHSAKVWDTGLYGCTYDSNIEEAIYVFVRGPHFFIKTTVHGFQVEDQFTIPCRSTWPPLDEEGTVELYTENELWKEASKDYDPRLGFALTQKNLPRKLGDGISFMCKYKTETINFFVKPKPVVEEEDLALLLTEETEFPYVGGTLEYTCLLEGKAVWDNHIVHRIRTECPRCKDDTVTHHKMVHKNKDELRNVTTVEHLTSQDSGVYTCSFYTERGADFELVKNVTKTITISATMEQIKMINRSAAFIEIDEGQKLDIFAEFRTFPVGESMYSSKWKRLFVPADHGKNESEPIINDDQRSVSTDRSKNVVEKLSVSKANVDMSGVYSLEVAVNNVTRIVEWQVRVRSKEITPHLGVASPNHWIFFDQDFYNVGSELRVICYVKGLPKAEVHLMKRRPDRSDEWEHVEGSTAIEGTTTKGYVLAVTADDNVEYKCEGRREGNKPVSESKTVRVSEVKFDAQVRWFDPESDTETTNLTSKPYEGDRLELDCYAPNTDQVSMRWLFGGKPAELTETSPISAHSKHLIAGIDRISTAQSGNYTCIVQDHEGKMQNMTRKLEVIPTTKPFLRDSIVDTNIQLKFGDAHDLSCVMDGTPEPKYQWYKDGVEVSDQISRRGQQLHIPRAAALDEGTYTCKAANRAGVTELSYAVKVKGAPKTLSGTSIVLIIIAFIVLLSLLIAAFVLYTRQRKTSKEQARSLQVLYEQLMRGADSDAPQLPLHGKITMDQRVKRTAYDPKYEIDMKNLVLLEALGAGQFGSVRKGRLARGAPVTDAAAYRGPSLTVAIKSPKNGSNPEDQKALIDELKILIAIDNLEDGMKHPNVLSLVGAVTKNMKDGQLFVVFEMCENGDLKTFLQKYKNEFKDRFINELREIKETPATESDDYLVPNRQVTVKYTCKYDPEAQTDHERDRLLADPKTLTTSDLLSFSMQVAEGMDFLSQVSCIHRDLAARNCLLTANRVVKIADFGMAKNEDKGYYRMRKTNVMVPYRWMAPESMEDHTFTVESDVWSYGIVLYEIFTLGSQPYPGVHNNSLFEHLKSGQRNPRPELAHPDIYSLMMQTWDKNVEKRPTFGECKHFMREQLQQVNPELLESADGDIARNAAQIAQFDQFRGPRATVILDDQEMAALFAGQSTPTNGTTVEEETGERIYIKELKR